MLELDDLLRRFGSVTALDGLSFSVQPGRITGFLGANGAGKTTAMRCIFGIVRPERGSVRWRGDELTPAMRHRFGYMPEQRGLYPKMAIADQLAYFGRLHGLEPAAATGATAELLTELGLADRAKDKVEALSHGNQQRIQLAAAMVHRPELLVLDEPFSGLDPLGVEALVDVLRARTAQGAAVMFSSHQLDLVEDLCEDVVLIDRGRLLLAGKLQEVRERASIRVAEVTFDRPVAWSPASEARPASDGAPTSEARPASEANRHGEAVSNGRMVSAAVRTGVDPASVLASAQAAGTVTGFVFRPPSVAEIFRDAVGR